LKGVTKYFFSLLNVVVTKYQKRVSGPLLDRIDILIEVPRVDYEKLTGNRIGNRVKRSENA